MDARGKAGERWKKFEGKEDTEEGKERERERGRVSERLPERVRARVRRGAAWDGELERDRTNVPAAHASNPEVA